MNQHVAPIDLEKCGHVIEIEQQVLGSVLFSSQHGAVRGTVKAEHFIEPLHRRIFEMIELTAERYNTATVSLVFKMFPADETKSWSEVLKEPLSKYSERNLRNRESTFTCLRTGRRSASIAAGSWSSAAFRFWSDMPSSAAIPAMALTQSVRSMG